MPQKMGGKPRPKKHSGRESLRTKSVSNLPLDQLVRRIRRKMSVRMALELQNNRHSDASKHLVDLQTPMDRRGHIDGAKHLMDQNYGGMVFHTYDHKGVKWCNGITIEDPPREQIYENETATLKDLDRWSANA